MRTRHRYPSGFPMPFADVPFDFKTVMIRQLPFISGPCLLQSLCLMHLRKYSYAVIFLPPEFLFRYPGALENCIPGSMLSTYGRPLLSETFLPKCTKTGRLTDKIGRFSRKGFQGLVTGATQTPVGLAAARQSSSSHNSFP